MRGLARLAVRAMVCLAAVVFVVGEVVGYVRSVTRWLRR